MNNIFYIFETSVKNVYKFGSTGKTLKDTLTGYNGMSKPVKVIGTINCNHEIDIKNEFQKFLSKYSIDILTEYGSEYFKFEGAIDILLLHFKKSFQKNEKVLAKDNMLVKYWQKQITHWFLDNYKETKDFNAVKVKEMYKNFKHSDTYIMAKNKTKLRRKFFISCLFSNSKIKSYHKYQFKGHTNSFFNICQK